MTPFPIELIIDAAEHAYNPTRFGQEMDEASEDDSEDSDTTSDSDLEEEEMCLVPKIEKKKKKTPELKAKEQKAKDQAPSTITPPSWWHVHFPQDKTDEIADLINKLGEMSINDPNYNVLYFLITSQAPHISPFLKSPPQLQDGSTPATNLSALTLPPQSKTTTSSYSGPVICYCCGEAGHGTDNAPLPRRGSRQEQLFEMTLAELCGRMEPPSCV